MMIMIDRSVDRWCCAALREAALYDVAQLREESVEVLVAVAIDTPLVGTPAIAAVASATLAVAVVERVHELHALHHLTEGCEALSVQKRIVREVEKYLRAARVLASGGEGDGAAAVALRHGVVQNRSVPPRRAQRRVCRDAHLRHKALCNCQSIIKIKGCTFPINEVNVQ